MTSEMGEMFNEIKAANKAKRRELYDKHKAEDWPTKVFAATGCAVVLKSQYHYHILDVGGYLINWWPSAGKWQWQKNGKIVHGDVDNLIRFINNRNGNDKKGIANANHGRNGTPDTHDASGQQKPQDVQNVAGSATQPSGGNHDETGGGEDDDSSPPW